MHHVKQYASEYKQQLSFCTIDFNETAPGPLSDSDTARRGVRGEEEINIVPIYALE